MVVSGWSGWVYYPSEAEIAETARAFQVTWTTNEREQRLGRTLDDGMTAPRGRFGDSVGEPKE